MIYLTIEEFYKKNEGIIQLIVGAIGIILAYIAIIQPLITFSNTHKKISKDKRFDIYHKLIDEFATGTKLDRQIAIVFEFRRFSEYYPVTKRILYDWKVTLQNSPPPSNRLLKEIDITISYINANWFEKKFCFKRK